MKPKRYLVMKGDECFIELCPYGATLAMFKRNMIIKYGLVKVKELK